MKIKVTTIVAQNYKSVMEAFTEELFSKLTPPFPPVRLLRFDGCKKDDVVALELNFILFKQQWVSLVVEDGLTQEEFYFIDVGVKLPFFLKYWRHHHRVIKDGQGTKIIDDLTFTSPLPFLDIFLWPILWLEFVYRKPIYKKTFAEKT